MSNLVKENVIFVSGMIRKISDFMGSSSIVIPVIPINGEGIMEGDPEKWKKIFTLAFAAMKAEKIIPENANENEYVPVGLAYKSYVQVDKEIGAEPEVKEEDQVITFDHTAFDKIVLPRGSKEKIIEVITQLKDRKKIFEEWGLGDKIKKGRGVNLLFTGESGTGKTYCGEIIAEYLGMKAEIVSSASFESKFIGESEKNLAEMFKNMLGKGKVLIIDEADSFLTSRGEVMMQHHESKLVNQFLMELEKHNGVVILTTNRAPKLDRAVQRRIDLTLEFPKPDGESRKKIWQHIIPEKMPKDKIDYGRLASFDINGGLIKNCVLAAARKAAMRGKKMSTNILIEAIKEEQSEVKSLKESKDHA